MKQIITILFLLSIIFLITYACVSTKEKHTLTYLMWGRPEEIKAVQKFITEFNKIYPEIKVNVIHTAQYYDKLKTMIAGGEPPDVMYMGSEYFPGYVARGTLLDLTPYIENDPDTKLKKFNIKDYFPETVKPFMYNGRYYGIPKDFTTMVVYYNKDLFDKEGIEYPNRNWTWEEFKNAAIKLTKDTDGDGIIDQFGFVFESWVGYWISWIRQNDSDIYDEKTGKYVIGKEPYLSRNVETFQFLYDLMYKYHCAPTLQETRDMEGTQLLETGKVAMCTYGRWRTLELKNVTAFRWDVAELPYKRKRATTLFTVCYSISKDSKNKLDAWKLVKFLVGEKGQIETAESCLAVPSLKPIAYSSHFLAPAAIPKVNAKAFLNGLSYAKTTPPHPNAQLLNDTIQRYLDEIFINKKPIRETLIQLQKEIDRITGERPAI